ncbi:uncharacterized protein LOC119393743 [Rhipicephalus sanguineus]|uniref:uncharacterized protein LOC119393743 n=1 Tax=Rhipicephalus sanguineus TaxID=34632 RepID=UPI0018951852|nr:uncharacterized protein LOC119393743 [Rhipicephalus sanguineus]XP_037516806.1 uncharacterized protein LOC119393743 [Rhipicephalus sanguineus]
MAGFKLTRKADTSFKIEVDNVGNINSTIENVNPAPLAVEDDDDDDVECNCLECEPNMVTTIEADKVEVKQQGFVIKISVVETFVNAVLKIINYVLDKYEEYVKSEKEKQAATQTSPDDSSPPSPPAAGAAAVVSK